MLSTLVARLESLQTFRIPAIATMAAMKAMQASKAMKASRTMNAPKAMKKAVKTMKKKPIALPKALRHLKPGEILFPWHPLFELASKHIPQ